MASQPPFFVFAKLCDRLLCNIVLNAILVQTYSEWMCIKILLSNYFISELRCGWEFGEGLSVSCGDVKIAYCERYGH